MSMASSSNSSSTDSRRGAHAGQPVSRPAPVQLTDEEKAVLLECRRNSVARGLPLGVASVVVLRWLVAQGRTPLNVQRWSWFYYSGAFLGSFLVGVASYRKTCFEKIMALDNSFLASQVKEHLGRIQTEGFKTYEGGCTPDAPNSEGTRRPKSQYQQQQEQRVYPPPRSYHRRQSGNATTSDAPSSVNADTYRRDKAALNAKEEQAEQPDAFGSAGTYPQGYGLVNDQDKPSTPSGGRTFDDIREENRRRQLKQSFPHAPSSGGSSGGDRRGGGVDSDWRQSRNQERQPGSVKRKNKYGDDVYED